MIAQIVHERLCCPNGCGIVAGVPCVANKFGGVRVKALLTMPAPERIALARALLADLPEIVVRVPDAVPARDVADGMFQAGFADGWNSYRVMLLMGSDK